MKNIRTGNIRPSFCQRKTKEEDRRPQLGSPGGGREEGGKVSLKLLKMGSTSAFSSGVAKLISSKVHVAKSRLVSVSVLALLFVSVKEKTEGKGRG